MKFSCDSLAVFLVSAIGSIGCGGGGSEAEDRLVFDGGMADRASVQEGGAESAPHVDAPAADSSVPPPVDGPPASPSRDAAPDGPSPRVTIADLADLRFESVETELTIPYRLYLPPAQEPGRRYPLVVYFHGAGGRGSNNTSQFNVSTALDWVQADLQGSEPFFVVYPQCPGGRRWVEWPWKQGSYVADEVGQSPPMRAALELVDDLLVRYPIDPDRVVVTGVSMGGFGTWEAMIRRPQLFAAGMPLCGAGDPSRAATIKHIPIWAAHGARDKTVPVSGSREMIEALKKAGGSPRYSEFEDVGHKVWEPFYSTRSNLLWLLAQRRP